MMMHEGTKGVIKGSNPFCAIMNDQTQQTKGSTTMNYTATVFTIARDYAAILNDTLAPLDGLKASSLFSLTDSGVDRLNNTMMILELTRRALTADDRNDACMTLCHALSNDALDIDSLHECSPTAFDDSINSATVSSFDFELLQHYFTELKLL